MMSNRLILDKEKILLYDFRNIPDIAANLSGGDIIVCFAKDVRSSGRWEVAQPRSVAARLGVPFYEQDGPPMYPYMNPDEQLEHLIDEYSMYVEEGIIPTFHILYDETISTEADARVNMDILAHRIKHPDSSIGPSQIRDLIDVDVMIGCKCSPNANIRLVYNFHTAMMNESLYDMRITAAAMRDDFVPGTSGRFRTNNVPVEHQSDATKKLDQHETTGMKFHASSDSPITDWVDGDSLVTWPLAEFFWINRKFAPFKDHGDMTLRHGEQLGNYLTQHPNAVVLIHNNVLATKFPHLVRESFGYFQLISDAIWFHGPTRTLRNSQLMLNLRSMSSPS